MPYRKANWKAARDYKEEKQAVEEQLEKLYVKAKREAKRKKPVVGEEEIADVVSGWTKIPVRTSGRGRGSNDCANSKPHFTSA